MKEPKLAPALAITISFHLMVSPVLSYAGPQDKVGTVLGAMNQVVGNGRAVPPPAAASQFTAAGEQILKQQLTPIPQDKLFNPRLAQIPGLASFFASHGASLNCTTLRSTLSEVQSDACKEIDPKKNIDTQVKETKLFEQYYKDINKMYGESFKTDSNSGGQLYGLGCMNKAKETLEQFFIHRETELTKLTNEIDKLNQNFKESSKQDLEKIEDAVAVLDGGDGSNGEIFKKVRERNKDLLNFGKNFSDPACSSMFSKAEFDSVGLSNGLNGILNDKVKKEYFSTESGISAEGYTTQHSKIVEDINSLAEKVSTQIKLNPADLQKGPLLVNDLKALSSSYNATANLTPDFFADIQLDFNNQNSKLQKAYEELGPVGGVEFRSDDEGKLDNQIAKLEKDENNSCLARDLRMDELKKKIFNPTVNKKSSANKAPSSFFQELESVVNSDYNFEEKLNKLKALDNDKMFNNRFFVKKTTSYKTEALNGNQVVGSERISANQMETPSLFISRIIKNCQAQYKVNKLPNKLTKEETFKKLKALNKDWKKLASNQASEMKNQVIKKLLNCPNKTLSAGSCSSKSFDVGNSFCARTALTCSNNMRQCTEQAQNFVNKFNQVKTVHTNNYKNHIKKHRSDMTNVFKSALARFEGDSGMLAKAFGAEFKTPGDIGYGAKGDASLKPFDPAMGLEDPEKYAEMFRANIVELKKSVQNQGTDILAKVDKHLKSTEDNYKIVAEKANRYAEDCGKSFKTFDDAQKQMAKDAEKRKSELGEKTAAFCDKYGMARENPGPLCKGVIEDLVKGAAGAVGQDKEASKAIAKACYLYVDNDDDEGTDIKNASYKCASEDPDSKLCKKLSQCGIANNPTAVTELTQTQKTKQKTLLKSRNEELKKEIDEAEKIKAEPPTELNKSQREVAENKIKDANKEFEENVAEIGDLSKPTSSTTSATTTTTNNPPVCDKSVQHGTALAILGKGPKKTTGVSLPSLPAACNATDNSNPSTPKSGIQGIMESLRRGISGTKQ